MRATFWKYPWSPSNTWDDGYPSGGNYWSDYNGTDYYRGPHQNETGSDGIGDTPYIFINTAINRANDDNVDRYPLMKPINISSQPPTSTSSLSPTSSPPPKRSFLSYPYFPSTSSCVSIDKKKQSSSIESARLKSVN